MFKSSKILLVIIIGCISTACRTQTVSKNSSLNGKWFIEFNSNDIGSVRSLLNFEFKDSTFVAYTRKGADRDLLGFWKSTLGRWFTKDFEHGSLINITAGHVKHCGDTAVLSAIFRSALGSYYFRGKIHNGHLSATLLNGRKESKGFIKGGRNIPPSPLCNYPALLGHALELTRNHIYNRSVFEDKDWKRFEKSMKALAPVLQDDIEMEFAFFYYASKLPFSHYSLLRTANDEEDKIMPGPAPKQVVLTEITPQTACMKIETFSGTAAEMDSAFSTIINKQYKNLIVDLRNNPGGSIEAGMSFATHLADTPFYGGVFLTQKWFEKNSRPPAVKDYSTLPHFTESNFDLVIQGIHKEAGLCLKIIPAKEVYRGRLFILTNSGTASTCEPIVYGLQQNKRALIVGERTAGAMLNGEFFKVSDGFSIIIPTAYYYTADGYKIDGQGVNPDIKTEQARALDYVMDNFIKKQ